MTRVLATTRPPKRIKQNGQPGYYCLDTLNMDTVKHLSTHAPF